MNGWLARYESGQQIQVWSEMTSMGAQLRGTEDWEEAMAVARVTMERARTNVERLIEALPGAGYTFANEQVARHIRPEQSEIEALGRLERDVGRMPLSLRCWFEIVGQVDLTGACPDWQFELLDPLVVHAPVDFIRSEYEAWEEERGTEWDGGPFEVPFAPDYLHKADISGGMPYAVRVPDDGVDALVRWEPHQTTFVNYLRIAFKWAGLPGWDPASGHGRGGDARPMPSELHRIADQLLPI